MVELAPHAADALVDAVVWPREVVVDDGGLARAGDISV